MVITFMASAACYVHRMRNCKTVGSIGTYTVPAHTRVHTHTHGEFLSSMTSIVNWI